METKSDEYDDSSLCSQTTEENAAISLIIRQKNIGLIRAHGL